MEGEEKAQDDPNASTSKSSAFAPESGDPTPSPSDALQPKSPVGRDSSSNIVGDSLIDKKEIKLTLGVGEKVVSEECSSIIKDDNLESSSSKIIGDSKRLDTERISEPILNLKDSGGRDSSTESSLDVPSDSKRFDTDDSSVSCSDRNLEVEEKRSATVSASASSATSDPAETENEGLKVASSVTVEVEAVGIISSKNNSESCGQVTSPTSLVDQKRCEEEPIENAVLTAPHHPSTSKQDSSSVVSDIDKVHKCDRSEDITAHKTETETELVLKVTDEVNTGKEFSDMSCSSSSHAVNEKSAKNSFELDESSRQTSMDEKQTKENFEDRKNVSKSCKDDTANNDEVISVPSPAPEGSVERKGLLDEISTEISPESSLENEGIPTLDTSTPVRQSTTSDCVGDSESVSNASVCTIKHNNGTTLSNDNSSSSFEVNFDPSVKEISDPGSSKTLIDSEDVQVSSENTSSEKTSVIHEALSPKQDHQTVNNDDNLQKNADSQEEKDLGEQKQDQVKEAVKSSTPPPDVIQPLDPSTQIQNETCSEEKGTIQSNELEDCHSRDSNCSGISAKAIESIASDTGKEDKQLQEDSSKNDMDVVPSSARADFDQENVEEPMDVGSNNEEDDPFFSCSEKEKDFDSQMHVDESDGNSEMYVDKSSNDDIPLGSSKPNEILECDSESAENKTQEKNASLCTSPGHQADITSDENDAEMKSSDGGEDLSAPTNETSSKTEDAGQAVEESSLSEKSSILTGVSEEVAVTSEKPSATALDGDDEVCIVPDTAPRVLTEKEKADAFEKAKCTTDSATAVSSKLAENKSLDEAVPITDEEPARIESTDSPKNDQESNDVSTQEKSNKESNNSKPKFNIQLVSTASLVSRRDESEDPGDSIETSNSSSEKVDTSSRQKCVECGKEAKCKYYLSLKGVFLCEDECYSKYKKAHDEPSSTPAPAVIKPRKLHRTFYHKCGQCSKAVDVTSEKSLTWETMDFCCEDCLEKYQRTLGSCCANCKGPVLSLSLGKYCVRFGYDMKQFCSAPCLEDFKKGLKVCSYCQKDISSGAEGFLAPVGDKGLFKDFCTQECMEKYDHMSNNSQPAEVTDECAVCFKVKPVKVQVLMSSKVQKLCSEPCFAAFKFRNSLSTDQCDMCKKHFELDRVEKFTVYYDEALHSFCCKTCMNVYILAKRKIVPCNWCKVKKYNFDMIKKTSSNGTIMMCSLHCLNLYQVSISAAAVHKQIKCDSCNNAANAQYHLTMSDATLRSFCSYNCVQSFQGKFSSTPITLNEKDKTPHPLGLPRRIIPKRSSTPASNSVAEKDHVSNASSMPVISSVTSLAPSNGLPPLTPQLSSSTSASTTTKGTGAETVKTVYKQQFIIRPPTHPEMSNCAVQVKPFTATKAVSCRPHSCTVGTQTDDSILKPVLIPVPVPIYIPTPMHMYTTPYPVPVPIVLPVPVPIFIPTTRNSAKGILKEIKRIQEKIPSDPYEAELLMMAEMVAGEKKAENTDTESEDGGNEAPDDDTHAEENKNECDTEKENENEKEKEKETENATSTDFGPENVNTNNTFGDEVLQIALNMASELDEPAVDFEAAVAPNTISQTVPSQTSEPTSQNDESDDDGESPPKSRSGRKRTLRSSTRSPSVGAKRGRKSSSSDSTNVTPISDSKVQIKVEPVERPDANMCLKFTFGVNAWKHWVTQKNSELEKESNTSRKTKPFKTDLLQLTADELNYSLSLFVKEVKKPNGHEYAPDTIYYLCLGIQQYLIENGRVENIFSDPYYEKFTDCLDEVAKQFSKLYSESQYLVTRIEEEHLWESKQLGAHSPYVLLSTLMFFNTKHFNLTSVDEHMQLSFTHIMKHWKRNPNVPGGPKAPGSRNVLLRFYPPQSALASNSKKKKVYEQQENEDNPLRCPVKLYEFYLSKCPESVKSRNDVFYLLPERSCVPDSPMWYSRTALGRDQLQKMLHRIKMVKEINML